MPSRALPIIVNASAGSAKDTEERILAACAAHGVTPRLLWARSGDELVALIRSVVAEQPARVVAAGGDGTLSTVASHIVGTAVELGILPVGTLNHFAKDLGIPLTLEAAVATALTGSVETVDVGSVNGVHFINNSSVGLYPRLVRARQREQQRIGRSKWEALLWAVVIVFRRYSHIAVTLAINGHVLPRRTPLVFVGNNRYSMQGLEIGSRVRLDAGELGVYVPRVPGRMGLLLLAVRAFMRSPRARDGLEVMDAQALTLSAHRREVLVSVDGEVRTMTPPLHYGIHPRALKVVVPQRDSTP